MKLLTQEILKAFEKQGDTSEKHMHEIHVICKLFNPLGAGTWYLYEYDPESRIFQGFVNLGDIECAECGSVSLDELEAITSPIGLGIERDMYFPIGKHTLEEVYNKVTAGGHV